MPILRTATELATARLFKSELLRIMTSGSVAGSGVAAAATDFSLDSLPLSSNVLGFGYGIKETLGQTSPTDLAVRVYVRSKLPQSSLSAAELVPPLVNGLATDVVAVGDLSAHIGCGVSIGHRAVWAGTAGCLVQRAGLPGTFVLSNNHVLAATSSVGVGIQGGPCAVGDDILQPASHDGGAVPGDVVASLSSWVPLDFSGAPNTVDAAVALVTRIGHFSPDILLIGNVTQPTMPVALYQSVRKWGRTTLHTIGVVIDIAVSMRVRYGSQHALFDDQIGIQGLGGAFSAAGDSGSLAVDAVTKRPVGLVFSGGSGISLANPIDDVLGHAAINATIV